MIPEEGHKTSQSPITKVFDRSFGMNIPGQAHRSLASAGRSASGSKKPCNKISPNVQTLSSHVGMKQDCLNKANLRHPKTIISKDLKTTSQNIRKHLRNHLKANRTSTRNKNLKHSKQKTTTLRVRFMVKHLPSEGVNGQGAFLTVSVSKYLLRRCLFGR